MIPFRKTIHSHIQTTVCDSHCELCGKNVMFCSALLALIIEEPRPPLTCSISALGSLELFEEGTRRHLR